MRNEHSEIIKKFETWLKIKDYKPRGIEEKIRKIKIYVTFVEENNLDLFTVSSRDALKFRAYLNSRKSNTTGLPLIAKTINDLIVNTKLFYKYLLLNDFVLTNPFMNVETMKEAYRIPRKILKSKQMNDLLEGIEIETEKDLMLKILLETLYSTGCRISELSALIVKDVNTAGGYIKITDDKARRNRIALLNEYTASLLALYIKCKNLNGNDRLFNHGAKSRTLNQYANKKLKKLTKKLKLPHISCHSIRHSTATHLLKNGADIREVQEILGHKQIDSTDVYTRIFMDDLKNVVEKNHPREMGVS
jgi:integrase/recombinase XerD